jgi:hypothetical protein
MEYNFIPPVLKHGPRSLTCMQVYWKFKKKKPKYLKINTTKGNLIYKLEF